MVTSETDLCGFHLIQDVGKNAVKAVSTSCYRSLASELVSPCLSTRSIWSVQIEIAREFLSPHGDACGLVVDIIKAFNVLQRPLPKAALLRLGFCEEVVLCWFAGLDAMERQVFYSGGVYGSSFATTGIPEGDPLSIIGMFGLCLVFKAVVNRSNSCLVPCSYADNCNWEVVSLSTVHLKKVVADLSAMMDACQLPVAAEKCWVWALTAAGRKALLRLQWEGVDLPVRLAGRTLGADMSYCYKVAAATRNERVSKGHRRLMRVRGRKCRLVLSSVFPQCLHAPESARVPDSVFQRLRSKVIQSLCLDGSVANPWLACSVAAPKNVDPEWNSLVSRIRLFRLVWKDFPNRRDLLQTGLYDHGSRNNGSSLWTGLRP